MARCIPTPAYLQGGGVQLTYGGAYVKLSSATSLIANHRVQTRLTSPPPASTPANSNSFLTFSKYFFVKKKKVGVGGIFHKGTEVFMRDG